MEQQQSSQTGKENNQGVQGISLTEKELIETIREAVVQEKSHEGLVLQHPGGARVELSSVSKNLNELLNIGYSAIDKLNVSTTKKNGMTGVL